MSLRPGTLTSQLLLSAAAAGTTWVALWSWSAFMQAPGRFLDPLFLLGVVVAGGGAVLRAARVPGPLVLAAQVVGSALVLSLLLSGSPVPVGDAWSELRRAFTDAWASSRAYPAPVPTDVPGIEPILIAGGLVCLLLVDLLACTLRRVPLAGLPLLMVYTIPVSVVGEEISPWVFVLTATGFLTTLCLQEGEQLARWGRRLGSGEGGLGARGGLRATAGAIGGVATALAVVLPAFVPAVELDLFHHGDGGNGSSEISIKNPMADLRRDLNRGRDIDLVRVRTDDPDPSYLRISVLNRFSDNEWSSGDRDVPVGNQPDGPMPLLRGVDASLPRSEYPYDVQVEPAFSSTWLPTEYPVSSVTADGDWRYDEATMDFIAGDKGLTTAGLRYSMTAVKLAYDPSAMSRAGSAGGMVGEEYTEVPDSVPTEVRTLAEEVTANATSPYDKAVALQDWFQSDGGFTYDLHSAPGNGTDDLVSFLTDGPGGRTGYCEQFAAAMATMARLLDIPARVAVGFLRPDKVGKDTYEFSAYDLHAWPEVFIPGSGWVRLEPTPDPQRGAVAPYYTRGGAAPAPTTQAPQPPRPSETATPRRDTVSASPTPSPHAAGGSGGDTGFPWGGAAAGLGVVLVAAGALLLPGLVRRRRRERRLAGGPEQAWAELRATALDLGVPWPESRSPREVRSRVRRFLGAPLDEGTPQRPARGPEVAPGASAALDRVVDVVERSRYARQAGAAPGLREDVEACLAALRGGATPAARRRAAWFPRSVLSRTPPQAASSGPVHTRHGGVVDEVG